MSFFEDVGKLLGFVIHKKKSKKDYSYLKKYQNVENKLDSFERKVVDAYLRIDEQSGKTYAKIFYEKNRPEWYWLKTHVSDDIINYIKQQSGIEDDNA